MSDTGLGVIRHRDRANWIRRASDKDGFERIEAFFDGRGYEMHRHDTYAVGLTLSGVQSFHYRGKVRHGLAGGALVLHPDEKHDGQAGTEGGFRYRMLYIEPSVIQAALGGRPLPFVEDGLSADGRLMLAITRLLSGLDQPLDPLEREDAIYDLAIALAAVSERRLTKAARIIDYRSTEIPFGRTKIWGTLKRQGTCDRVDPGPEIDIRHARHHSDQIMAPPKDNRTITSRSKPFGKATKRLKSLLLTPVHRGCGDLDSSADRSFRLSCHHWPISLQCPEPRSASPASPT